MTRLQEWDYFMAIASVKRQQSLYQGTLVAQGAFSVYRTDVLKKINGWPECIGEDIVLTWSLIKAGYRIGFESSSIGFTEVPSNFNDFARQRRRWARGMIEGFRNHIDVLYKKRVMAAYLIALDLLFPILDLSYTFIYVPGIILALLGMFWLAGPMTLAVLPLSMLINYVMYRNQRKVFSELDLRMRKNRFGLVAYTLIYQVLLSPVCVWGYAQEMTGYAKKW
jgi:biofilm PGA synthesis N-glycosyltransferase PgaC